MNTVTKAPNPLEAEMDTFRQHKARLIAKHKQGIAVMRGDEVLGVWQHRTDALQQGLTAYGDVSFLVRDINANRQPPVRFGRDLWLKP